MPYEIYAPLEHFHWEGEQFQLGRNLWIRRRKALPSLDRFKGQLSADEWERSEETAHWLHGEWDGLSHPQPSAMGDLALLCLWLVKPTRARLTLRFHIERLPGTQTTRSRVLDRFAWVDEVANPDFAREELELAARYYETLIAIYATQGRLNNALLLTVTGCWSHFWQAALVCHAAALEAMLTYSTGGGITRRLATSYACTVEADAQRRDAAFREFMDLYSTRSDIMHGRPHNVGVPDRLPRLIRFQSLLRSLWRALLSSPQLVATLEGTDAQRAAHFIALQHGYVPPQI